MQSQHLLLLPVFSNTLFSLEKAVCKVKTLQWKTVALKVEAKQDKSLKQDLLKWTLKAEVAMRTGLRSGLCGACDQRGSPLHSIASALPSQRTPPGLSPPPAFPQRGGGASLCSTDAGLRPPASSRWSPDTHDSYSRLAGSRMPLLQIVPNARLGTERCDKSHPSPTPYKQNMSFSCQLTPGSASI